MCTCSKRLGGGGRGQGVLGLYTRDIAEPTYKGFNQLLDKNPTAYKGFNQLQRFQPTTREKSDRIQVFQPATRVSTNLPNNNPTAY